MKYIHILVTGKDCDIVNALALTFDNCNVLVDTQNIDYATNSTEDDIRDIINTNYVNYSLVIDHVGGRPKRR